jgi:hypothetical protein
VDLFDFDFSPPRARGSDPETSHAAAADALFHASVGRALVLEQLGRMAQSDFELADATGWQQTSIGKRRHECMMAGFVAVCLDASGCVLKRPTPSGSMARVWQLTPEGVAFVAAHKSLQTPTT